MFSKKKQPPIRSLIADGCSIQGDLTFTDGLRIDGSVEGCISSSSTEFGKTRSLVFISQSGKVTGSITADVIIVNGCVNGPIQAKFLLEVQPKARISGDVSYKQLEMHPGAMIAGRMQPMDDISDVVAKPQVLENKPVSQALPKE